MKENVKSEVRLGSAISGIAQHAILLFAHLETVRIDALHDEKEKT